ncbi:MAG: hypothetical protein QOC96_642 [Acidobacteriota bacterium]|jgi:formylglycine-generating enzyme required for sulfatase activity|nr:hypothetical protein [Acidobacteriota bacterium]
MKKLARTFALCLVLIVMGCALVFSQVGVDKRPPKTPKTSTPKTPTKRTTTRTPSPAPRSKPRQTAPNIEMVYVQGGTFLMGSPDGAGRGNEHPQHQVTVQSFYMGKYEVTQAQYRALMGKNPSYRKGCDECPVEMVSWDDAQVFIKRLNGMQSRYTYRLPSEAEWEYACRAGTIGDYAGNLDALAWYYENSGDARLSEWNSEKLIANKNRTHPVGQKQPNAWGLYDMHGNVWEWCEDVYVNSYNGAPTDSSTWLSREDSKVHVERGGSFNDEADPLRSAYRDSWNGPNGSIGFRLVAVFR